MGIDHVFDMRQTVSATRVMRGPVGGLGGALPVVVGLQIGRTIGIVEMRTEIFRRFLSQEAYLVRGNIMASRGDILDYLAIQGASSAFHQASSSFLACDPMIDVRLYHEFLPNLFPQVEVHGTQLGLS